MSDNLQPLADIVNAQKLIEPSTMSCNNSKMDKDENEERLKIERGNRLAAARMAARPHLSQAKLGQLVGVSPQTVQSIEAGKKGTKLWEKFEKILGLPQGYLLYGKGETVLSSPQALVANVPILSWENAFNWPKNANYIVKNNIYEVFSSKLILSAASYVLEIPDHQYETVSESNAPFFRKGAYIIIDPEKSYKNNDFVVAKINNGSRLILRRYVKYDSGEEFLKIIADRHRDPLMYLTSDIQICGVVVACLDFLS